MMYYVYYYINWLEILKGDLCFQSLMLKAQSGVSQILE